MSGLKALSLPVIRQQLFAKALVHVNKVGWNDRVLAMAADEMGCSTALAGAVVPGGIYQLIAHCMQDWEERLKTDITPEKLAGKRKYARLRIVLEQRLRYQIPYAQRWQEAIYIGAHPSNFTTTSSRLLSTFDVAWHLARNPLKDVRNR